MKMNSKHQFAITLSALILSFALIDSLTVQVQSSGQQGSPGDAAGRMDNKRAALRHSLRKSALKRLGASRWDKFGESDAYELDETVMPARSTLGGTLPSLNASARNNGETTVVVRDVGPEFGGSFSLTGFIINRNDPKQIILPTIRRMFRSSNRGQNWSPIELLTDEGFNQGTIIIRQSPQNAAVLFAVTGPAAADSPFALYRSNDFGDIWTPLLSDFFDPVDCALSAASPGNMVVLTLFAFETGDPDHPYTGPLFKSVDGGTTFEILPATGLPRGILDADTGQFISVPVYSNIATTPAEPDTLYVVMEADSEGLNPPSIYKSVDGGQSFSRLKGGPPNPVWAFPHPTIPNVLFVLDSARGIYRSLDGGASFSPVTSGIPNDGYSWHVAFDTQHPSHVYISTQRGLYRSTNGGSTFSALGLTGEQIGSGVTTASVDPSNSNTIYVNTRRGNYKSQNDGHTFKPINTGFRATGASHIAFDQGMQPSLYLATADVNGILRTRTRGNHYESVPHPSELNSATLLAIAPSQPSIIFAATRNSLFRSLDAGATWSQASTNTGGVGFFSEYSQIEVDPSDPNKVYFVTSDFLGTQKGFYRSIDAGASFQRTAIDPAITFPEFSDLAIDPLNTSVMYTGTGPSHNMSFGPLKSTNSGVSFTNGPINFLLGITDIAIDPIDSENVYLVGTFFLTDGVHSLVRSLDGGVTYFGADGGLPTARIFGIVIDPQRPARLYAWTGRGLFMTSNRGATWTLLEDNETVKVAQPVSPNTIAINPKKPNLLYLAGTTVLEVEIRHRRTDDDDVDDDDN